MNGQLTSLENVDRSFNQLNLITCSCSTRNHAISERSLQRMQRGERGLVTPVKILFTYEYQIETEIFDWLVKNAQHALLQAMSLEQKVS